MRLYDLVVEDVDPKAFLEQFKQALGSFTDEQIKELYQAINSAQPQQKRTSFGARRSKVAPQQQQQQPQQGQQSAQPAAQ